ncbi:MAG: conjugal transfer protein TraF [Rhodospirillaceae bacterium]|nr:conjugal transfer protein TraF [Rhodospirillaceae bacterium]
MHPPIAGLVRVRLEARAHPAPAGAAAAWAGLGQLPGLHRGRGRAHRLRRARPLRVHPGPDGRLAGAGRDASRGRRDAIGHAGPGARLLRDTRAGAATVTARALKRLLAALGVWAALGAPAAGGDTHAGDTHAGEWRSWCGDPGSGSGNTLGWHFYCDRQQERREDEAVPVQPAPEPPAASAGQPATERILELRRALEEARADAILNPTAENVTAYLRLQQETLQRAAAFSDAFRRTVWATPELDYTLKRPVGALAKQVWSDGRRQAREAALARLGERYGLIYLGHAGCAGCKVFGPLLRAFAVRHGLDVLAISLTGEALEGWPEAVADQGRAARLGLGGGPGRSPAPVPALVLFDTKTQRVVPVGFGVMAEDEMAERLFALTALEPGHDY